MNIPPKDNIIFKFLRNFDIFGIIFNFRIESEGKFQSSTGGCFLFGYLILCITIFTNTLLSYFNSPQFNSNFSEKLMNNTDPNDYISLGKEMFNFGIFIDNLDPELEIDKTYLIKLFYREKNLKTNNNYQKTELKQIKCDYKDFTTDEGLFNQTYIDHNLNMKCFDLLDFKLRGVPFDSDYSDFQAEIHIKKDANFTKVRKSIEKYHPQYKFVFSDLLVDSKDFSLYKITPNEIHDYLEWDKMKVVEFFIFRCIFIQDLNYYFNSKEEIEYSQYDRSLFRSAYWETSLQNTRLTVLNVRSSQNAKVFDLSFVKLITVIQMQLTNLLNYLIVFKIIATLLNVKKAEFHLVKKLFDEDDRFISELKQFKIKILSVPNTKKCENLFFPVNKNISNYEIKKNENIDMKGIKFDLDLENEKNNFTNQNQNNNEQLKILKNQTSLIQDNNIDDLKINEFNSINNTHKDKSINSLSELNSNRIISSDIPKINKIQDSTKKIDENKLDEFYRLLEVTAYIKKMQEIELLKYLLFDENTIYLFNYLVGKINLFDSNQISYDFKNRNLQDLIKTSFIEMKENPKIGYMDKKILNLFENYIENY